jgi:hypothetical protein
MMWFMVGIGVGLAACGSKLAFAAFGIALGWYLGGVARRQGWWR